MEGQTCGFYNSAIYVYIHPLGSPFIANLHVQLRIICSGCSWFVTDFPCIRITYSRHAYVFSSRMLNRGHMCVFSRVFVFSFETYCLIWYQLINTRYTALRVWLQTQLWVHFLPIAQQGLSQKRGIYICNDAFNGWDHYQPQKRDLDFRFNIHYNWTYHWIVKDVIVITIGLGDLNDYIGNGYWISIS